MATPKPELEARFRAAVEAVRALPASGPVSLGSAEKLAYYAWFKQATEGPCATPQPSLFDVANRMK